MGAIVGAHYIVTASSLNLRKTPGTKSANTVLRELARGTVVELLAEDADPQWWQVRTASGDEGFVARRYLSPISSGIVPVFDEANAVLWQRTVEAEGKVKYKLSSKNSKSGAIDCSGWVAEITGAAFGEVNTRAGEAVFDADDKSALQDHSDGIVCNVEKRTGRILKGEQVTIDALREGMVVGVDSGLRDFEKGQNRVYGIDHIVQVVRDPATRTLFITQSSSSGGGVNRVLLESWLARRKELGYMATGKIFATDPFVMADENTAYVRAYGTGV